MPTVLRLSRAGAKKRPFYRIVAADSRKPRDGQFIEKLGTFNPLLPKDNTTRVTLNAERAKYWLSVGAQPSDRVNKLLVELELAKPRSIEGKPQKARKKAEKLTRAEKRAQADAAPKEEAAAAVAEAPAAETPAEAAAAEAPAGETAA
ncbi:MAG: 30S ribosomal protein S16 [Alphaproteobacteria bacterium]